ncbi:MAG: ABC transporter permease subunit [Gammaproteobacteria bacterium]|nr:ABC transporter permease subunit [Gammaproteobacteria bacterium]MXX16274.1 ABC transporter permease subunit [Gammaproteobacteria bacterium]MYH89286.1 ABC transporter permease subunit [Gammaproteobacteria bacterium]
MNQLADERQSVPAVPAGEPREDQADLVREFVGTGREYYQRVFHKLGSRSGFRWSFNPVAALIGPVWYGMRGVWNWCMPFAVMETFCFIQIARGLFGDLAAEARNRMVSVQGTLDFRRQQLETAIENEAPNVDVFKRAIESLESGILELQQDVIRIEESAITVAMTGIGLLVLIKLVEGLLANTILERRFSDWLCDRTVAHGISGMRMGLSGFFFIVVVVACVMHYSFPGRFTLLVEFPTNPEYRLTAIDWVKQFFTWTVLKGEWFFDVITLGIRTLLDALEVVFVETPWVVIASFIVLLTWLSAGPRTAIWAGAFLAYMGLLGFWVKAMTTLALLGTAALISISIGIPVGMFCARRPRVYAVLRPIMDFMQTMPAFVFMIPVIAFFGTGKPAAIVTTMIFGGTPVVRLTVLGLRGVPEHIREAAIAYGASKWYLLRKVDLPLAAPSILAGVNQTIMLSLAMVVVASLIGAKGLGEDVLEALQYASVGQGILAGFSILFCAMILDQIVQGRRKGQ